MLVEVYNKDGRELFLNDDQIESINIIREECTVTMASGREHKMPKQFSREISIIGKIIEERRWAKENNII